MQRLVHPPPASSPPSSHPSSPRPYSGTHLSKRGLREALPSLDHDRVVRPGVALPVRVEVPGWANAHGGPAAPGPRRPLLRDRRLLGSLPADDEGLGSGRGGRDGERRRRRRGGRRGSCLRGRLARRAGCGSGGRSGGGGGERVGIVSQDAVSSCEE